MTSSNFEEQKLAYRQAIDSPTATLDVNPVIVAEGKKIILAKRIPSDEQGGKWSMPGGKIFVGERIEDTLKRITLLKTGLEVELLFNSLNESLVGVYDGPERDPRAHVIGVTFFCKPSGGEIKAGGNSEEVRAFSADEIRGLDLAFDHREILSDALNKLSFMDVV